MLNKKHPYASYIFLIVALIAAFSSVAQTAPVLNGSVVRIKVHGKTLEGNLEGDSPDRDVSIYLPANYHKEPRRRYPVVYFLHGFTDDDAQWYGFKKHWINMPAIIDKVFSGGQAKEMIVVTPNAYTRYQGSMYSTSVTTGDWENFVAKELVAYIDSHYRTLAQAESRGLAGHSMGGYGALRIGEKHPEIFSAIYLLSPCCLMPGTRIPQDPKVIARIDSVKTPADFEKLDFGTKALFASAAAWSPDPQNAPLYVELPYKNGKLQSMVPMKWWANMPLATLDQYIPNLRKLKDIAFDAGNRDSAIAASIQVLDSDLKKYNVPHHFEIYEGTHISRVGERIEQKMLDFFSKNLLFDKR